MRRQGLGHIVNTKSMAGLVFVLCPGAIRTPILEGGRYGVLTPGMPEDEQRRILRQFWQRYRPMDPLRLAHAALDAVARYKTIVVIPSWWKILWWIERASPTLSLFLARRVLAKSMRGLFGPGASRDETPTRSWCRPARRFGEQLRASGDRAMSVRLQ